MALCREALALTLVPSSAMVPTLSNPARAQTLRTSTKRASSRARWTLRKSLMVRKSGTSSPTMTRQATSSRHRVLIRREDRVPVAWQ